MKNIQYFLLITFLCLGVVHPSTRVRRQGITFSDEDDSGSFNTFGNRRPPNGGRFQFDNGRPFGNGNGNGQNQFNNGRFPQNSWDTQGRLTSTTARAPTGAGSTTTTAAPAFRTCMSGCLSTPEYNPVCGSDGTTYPNEGRMRCANRCGANVVKVFGGTCQPL